MRSSIISKFPGDRSRIRRGSGSSLDGKVGEKANELKDASGKGEDAKK